MQVYYQLNYGDGLYLLIEFLVLFYGGALLGWKCEGGSLFSSLNIRLLDFVPTGGELVLA